jgi:hypothetical protein
MLRTYMQGQQPADDWRRRCHETTRVGTASSKSPTTCWRASLSLGADSAGLRDHAYANSYQQTGSAIPERLADPSRASLPGSTFPSQHGSVGHIERVALNH